MISNLKKLLSNSLVTLSKQTTALHAHAHMLAHTHTSDCKRIHCYPIYGLQGGVAIGTGRGNGHVLELVPQGVRGKSTVCEEG